MDELFAKKERYSYEDFLKIMEILRKECPWDREQTHESIKKCLIEEAYESAEAIDSKNGEKMADELGDLLLQVVFHAQIGKEHNEFTMDDVTDAVSKKMIRRHPHIFSNANADSADAVLDNWDAIKKMEKGDRSKKDELNSISKYLPALMRAQKVSKKLAKWGLETGNMHDFCAKMRILLDKIEKNGEFSEKILGELLFTNAAIARVCGFEAEECLNIFLENCIKSIEK